MGLQTDPKLRGVVLLRKMLDNKKLIQAQSVENYRNNPAMQEAFQRLDELEKATKITRYSNNHKRRSLDKKIPETLRLIFEAFFQSNKNIAIYICDSLDNKQTIRFRKFNDWFIELKTRAYVKMDLQILD